MRKIIISLVIVVIASSQVFLFSWYRNKNAKVTVPKDITVEKQKSTKISKEEIKDDEEIEEKQEEQSKSSTDNISSEKSISRTENSTKESKNSINIPQESPKIVQSEPVEQPTYTEPVQETQPSVSHPWDVYGMTEYQYYNEPLYSWEKVDYSVGNYGSEQAAYSACTSYGDNYEPYKQGQVLYNCRRVVSASGNFLGIMFSTENLN